MPTLKRIAILTGGGDCPGLNAVIRAVTLDALRSGIEVVGICDGFLGLIKRTSRTLTQADVEGVLNLGGTLLGTNNKSNPFRFATGKNPDGSPIISDVSPGCLEFLTTLDIDGLIVAGGDGSMTIASELSAAIQKAGLKGASGRGIAVVGIPKTIDNDLPGTDLTFGFLTAVRVAADAIDRIHTTAASHHRAMVVEVMGRNAGWIALYAGLGAGADVILLPEISFSFDRVIEAIHARRARGVNHSVIVASEGARPEGGEQIVAKIDPTSPDPIRLGGIARYIADEIERRAGIESRYVVLGHVQRGGTPEPEDRVLGTLFGHRAMDLLRAGKGDRMVAMRGVSAIGETSITDVDLHMAAGKQRLVPPGHPLIAAARAVGTCFGD